ncbi:MAG TPA: AAA family ATPase [Bryobacteraceae bacterium]
MFLERLTLKKLLSFNDCTLDLRPLNVLIGPNAVGKSNLIEAISLLQAAPTGIAGTILRGGGVRQWLWLGDAIPPVATIECDALLSGGRHAGPINYQLQFSDNSHGFMIILEERLQKPNGHAYLIRSSGSLNFGPAALESGASPSLTNMGIPPNESILSQFRYPADPTPATELGSQFSNIQTFREFRTGPGSAMRHGIPASVRGDALEDGGENLGLVLNELDFFGVHDRIREYLRRFCERFEDIKIRVAEGMARAYLREAGLSEMLSAVRMSDGTLKFLALLTVLFHPTPPPLLCLEEPEVGLHPDALQLVAEALLEASQTTQLIVTTHSEALVDALSERPETVLVCERDFDNGTQMKRLSKEDLREWLEDYSLGQLWRKGEIGGSRC